MPKIAHIVLWKLKPQGDSLVQAQQAIAALKSVPGPESVSLGPPAIEGRTKGFNWGLFSIFASREALDTYAVSDAHMKVVKENVRPNVEDILAYDFEIPE